MLETRKSLTDSEVRILKLSQKSGQENNRGLADSLCQMCSGGKYGAPICTYIWCKMSPGQEAVSVMSPSQSSAEAALLQLRDLNISIDLVASHPDHSPHSDQVPAAPAEKK